MKRLFIYIFLFCIFKNCWAQNNLVPNYSFEQFSSCPTIAVGQIHYATPWFQPNNNGIGGGSSDYIHFCAGYTCQSILQCPRSGIAVAGIAVLPSSSFNQDYGREYLEVGLIDTLKINLSYCVSFYANKVNESCVSVKQLQAVLTPDTLKYNDVNYSYITGYAPVIESTAIITDTSNWVRIFGSYTASGDERFITIGNFNSGILTDSLQGFCECSPVCFSYSYYWIDDVSVYEQPEINAGLDSTIYLNDTVFNLGPQNVRPDVIYSWSPAAGLSNPNSPNPFAFPNQTTTYTLTITDTSQWACSPTLTDQITITVIDTTFNPDEVNLFVPNAFSPNGDNNNDILFVRARYTIEQLEFKVFDRWGVEVFSTINPQEGWNGKYKNKELNSAVFFYYAKVIIKGREYSTKGNVTLMK